MMLNILTAARQESDFFSKKLQTNVCSSSVFYIFLHFIGLVTGV